MIYLVLISTEAGALPLHAFECAEDAAAFIADPQRRRALHLLGGTFRITSMPLHACTHSQGEESPRPRECPKCGAEGCTYNHEIGE